MEEPRLFERLLIDSYDNLKNAQRVKCPVCESFRMYFCYECCVPLVNDFPQVILPVKALVLKCKKEPRSKSSVVILKVLCPETSEIIDCLGEDDSISDFPDGTLLLYPGKGSKSFAEFTDEELLSFKSLVFIDSTWQQSKSMMRNQKVASLPMVKLENHTTAFWRYQNESKNSLATIEAVYYAYVDYHKELKNRGIYSEDYQGQYDNLLWHFSFTYQRIQEEYNRKRHKGKRFRKNPEYIKKIDN